MQALIFSQVNFTHPAFAQLRKKLEMTEAALERWLFRRPIRREIGSGMLQHSARARVFGQQRFYFAPQLCIVGASFGQPRSVFVGRVLQGGMKQLLDLSPAVRIHELCPGLHRSLFHSIRKKHSHEFSEPTSFC
jgi:hypothetical protein